MFTVRLKRYRDRTFAFVAKTNAGSNAVRKIKICSNSFFVGNPVVAHNFRSRQKKILILKSTLAGKISLIMRSLADRFEPRSELEEYLKQR